MAPVVPAAVRTAASVGPLKSELVSDPGGNDKGRVVCGRAASIAASKLIAYSKLISCAPNTVASSGSDGPRFEFATVPAPVTGAGPVGRRLLQTPRRQVRNRGKREYVRFHDSPEPFEQMSWCCFARREAQEQFPFMRTGICRDVTRCFHDQDRVAGIKVEVDWPPRLPDQQRFNAPCSPNGRDHCSRVCD